MYATRAAVGCAPGGNIGAGLRELRFCEGISPVSLEALSRRSALRTARSGELVAVRGDSLDVVYAVSDGFIKSETVSDEGDRFLADVHGAGEVVGLEALLSSRALPFSLRAEGPVTLIEIGVSTINHVAAREPRILRNISEILARRYDIALEQLQAQSLLGAEGALALCITRLTSRFGVPDTRGGTVLPFRLTQEELGAAIGVTREAVGRVLRRWEHRTWVHLGYARLVVRDPKALAAIYSATQLFDSEVMPIRA